MSDFEIDFEWPVGKYNLRPATAEEIDEEEYEQDMVDPPVADVPEADKPIYYGFIVPTGRAQKRRPTSEAMEKSVRALVECKQTPFHRIALTVARTLGGLNGSKWGDRLLEWRYLAYQLRRMFEGKAFIQDPDGDEFAIPPKRKEVQWPHPGAQERGELKILLVPGRDKKPLLAIRPPDLRNALILYAARMIATGTTFSTCMRCNTPFLSGGSGQSKKRGDARFCSDECRYKYHNEMRRKKSKL
jgi:hypothetical protein